MFQRLPDAGGKAIRFWLDGAEATAREGESVAAALLLAGRDACRETAVSETPRGPWCMMGVCFDCLVTIDGVGNRQGCLVRLAEGMRVETQHGKRDIAR